MLSYLLGVAVVPVVVVVVRGATVPAVEIWIVDSKVTV